MTTRKKHSFSLEKRNAGTGLFFISIFLIGFVIIYVPALFYALRLSFSKTDADFNMTWVGLENYYHIFRVDPDFIRDVFSTMGSLLVDVLVIILYSLFVCTLLNRNIRGKGVFRALLFLPVIISTGCIDRYMNYSVRSMDIMSTVSQASGSTFSSDTLTSYILSLSVSEELTNVLNDVIQNIYSIITKSGVQIIIFLAGLQSISPSIYEAAYVEGCSAWESYWKITIPMLSPLISVNMVYTVVDSFTNKDNVVMENILDLVMNKLEYGYSTAMAWVYFLLIVLVLAVVLLVMNRVTYYEN